MSGRLGPPAGQSYLSELILVVVVVFLVVLIVVAMRAGWLAAICWYAAGVLGLCQLFGINADRPGSTDT